MTDSARIIRRLLRVNHAGEHGAIFIYTRQLERSKRHYPELVPWLADTLVHEIEHRRQFHEAMPTRDAKPCRALTVWSIGGTALGAVTALFGRTGIYICTAAVERTVHRHLEEQVSFLQQYDPSLSKIVTNIMAQESEHLEYADKRHNGKALTSRLLSFIVSGMTELLILISTRGDSMRLKQALRTH